MEDIMANETQLNELLRMRIDWVKDPVPDWYRVHLKPEILRELTLHGLEHAKSIHEANLGYIANVIKTVNRAKG